MRRILGSLAVGLAIAATAWGDAVVLKDGRKLSGTVKEKPDGYEVTVEGQVLGFDKDDVARWIKSPKELTGDAEKLYEEAKLIYSEAVEIKEDLIADKRFHDALPKVTKAREIYAEARDLFPDGHPYLDEQLIKVMKLMRLVRERCGSQIASAGPAPVKAKDAPPPRATPAPVARPVVAPPTVAPPAVEPPPTPVEPPKVEGAPVLSQALAILVDPAKRADPVQRETARVLFKRSAEQKSLASDVAAAGYLFLSRPDAEWGLAPEPLAALQQYFKGLESEKLETVDDKAVADGVVFLAGKVKEFKAKRAAVDALELFAAGPASALVAKHKGVPPKELEAAFKDLGYERSDLAPVWGDKAGLAMDDYRRWVSSGEYGLAVVQFQSDYRSLGDFGVRYAHALLSVFKALADNRGYTRAASVFDLLSRAAPSKAAADHAAAMAKSVREESPCPACGGTHQVNCSACKGKQKLNLQCGKCGGSGSINSLRGVVRCVGCNGAGIFRNVDCPKCKATGKAVCKAKGCDKVVKAPTFESFADAYKCAVCRGQGSLLKHVAYPCRDCSGIGLVLQPKADPAKLLR
jgi:hypothetical protein